jgi:hypothetical protein
MAKFKLPGISTSEGMKQMDYTTFPQGEYLLKIEEVTVADKTEGDTVLGTTFTIKSKVLGADKLPANENVRDYVDKTYTDFIFVMAPAHPSYSNTTKIGGTVGAIGLSALKSFLDAAGVKIDKNDEFDEQKAVGKWIEVRVGVRGWKDQQGVDRKGNQVYEYRAHVDEAEVAETVPAVTFEDDDLA